MCCRNSRRCGDDAGVRCLLVTKDRSCCFSAIQRGDADVFLCVVLFVARVLCRIDIGGHQGERNLRRNGADCPFVRMLADDFIRGHCLFLLSFSYTIQRCFRHHFRLEEEIVQYCEAVWQLFPGARLRGRLTRAAHDGDAHSSRKCSCHRALTDP